MIGKFLAANVIHAVAALIIPLSTLPFLVYGKPPDPGQVAAAYLTALGIGALFLGRRRVRVVADLGPGARRVRRRS